VSFSYLPGGKLRTTSESIKAFGRLASPEKEHNNYWFQEVAGNDYQEDSTRDRRRLQGANKARGNNPADDPVIGQNQAGS